MAVDRIKSKRWTKSLQAAILMAALLNMTGCNILPETEEALAPPLKEPPAITYETVDVKKGSIVQQITGRGIFESVSSSDIYFNLRGGYLKNIYVKAGDEVKKGDVLAELDTDSLKLQISQQQMQVETNEALYEKIKTTGEMEIELAKKQLDDRKKEYGKAITIQDTYSANELENMERKIEQLEMDLRKLVLSYEEDEDGNEGYELRLASATLAASKERLLELETELDKSQCLSPIDGVVVYRADVKTGEYIETFRTLLRISNPEDVHLIYEEKDLEKSVFFKTGVKVRVEEESNVFDGVVLGTRKDLLDDFGEGRISESEKLVHRNEIVIKVKAAEGKIEAGDQYNVVLVLQKKENIILIPNRTIVANGQRKFVYVLVNGVRYERDIEVGIVSGSESEIISGLKEGEKVVVR